MSDSLSKFAAMQDQQAQRKQVSFQELLKQGQESILMKEPKKKEDMGVMEQILFNQNLLMAEMQKIKTYVGLKPELIRLKDMKLYYPEFSSAGNIANKRCQGKKLPYIEKFEGSLYVVTQKYEMYRKSKLGL
ncbi:MAG: hypothetical protein KC646_10370 [Candidatus Cloacimonetes bacterium]|nr:hypothetical protein [Candidatus Cloacimonadota bacterium]